MVESDGWLPTMLSFEHFIVLQTCKATSFCDFNVTLWKRVWDPFCTADWISARQ